MKKKVLSFIGIVVVMGMVFWVSTKDKKKDAGTGNNGLTIQRPKPMVEKESANKLIWNVEQSDWPSAADIFQTSPASYVGPLSQLMEATGLKEEDRTTDNPQISIYLNKTTGKSIYVGKKISELSFDQNLESLKQLNATTPWRETEIKDKFIQLTEKVINNDQIKVKISDIKYFHMVKPRWVSSTSSDAEMIEIQATYEINGAAVATFYDQPITGDFDRDGKLLKFSYIPLAEIKNTTKGVPLKNLDELKATKANEFKIWDKIGDSAFGLGEDQAIGDSITITQARLVYIQSDRGDSLWPYFMLEGNSISANGPVKVYLITPANK